MKISKIELIDYQQFKDVVIDLTYPKGHKKAGKPLDKVCFIGQSGTGKTTILRLIKYFVSRNRLIGPNFKISEPIKDTVIMNMFQGSLYSRKTVDVKSFYVSDYKFNGEKIEFEEYLEKIDDFETKNKPFLINYPAEVIRGKSDDFENSTEEDKKKKIKDRLEFIETLEPQSVVDFAIEEIENMRNYVFKEIKEHRAKELNLKNQMSNKLLEKSSTAEDLNKLNKTYENWIKKNPDPLKILAEQCLDPILNRFGLKIKTKIDLETILDLGEIQLQTLTGIDVDRTFWSTGTRHIVDTVLPIFELKPKNAVILMDEPEKSLYPDIQEMAVDFYTNLAPECQFFYATHSPIIASSFDPWEVFNLEFDDDNKKVRLTENFTGERHVDNYNFYPKYLRWDSILKNVFNLADEGNNERETTLLEIAILKKEIEKMVEEKKQKSVTFRKKKEEFLKLSKKVGWDEKTF
jgi:energy-coupling factor transporter ATP-binding protein EcfA2